MILNKYNISYTFKHLQIIQIEYCHILVTMSMSDIIRRTWPRYQANQVPMTICLNSVGILQVLWHYYQTLTSGRCPAKPGEVL